MGAWEFKAILEISLINLIFLGTTGISTGLWLNRYNRRQSKSVEKQEEQNVEQINKPYRGRAINKLKIKNKRYII